MMQTYQDQVTSHSGPCSDLATAANLISDEQTYYSGTLTSLGTFGAVSPTGNPTAERTASSYTGGTEQWQTTTSTAYDGVGRVTDAVDATGQKTHTDFTPAWSSSGGNTAPTKTETYNSQQWRSPPTSTRCVASVQVASASYIGARSAGDAHPQHSGSTAVSGPASAPWMSASTR